MRISDWSSDVCSSDLADGRALLVVHGDEFDAVMLAHRWLAFVGDAAYTALMKANVVVNAIRSRLGLPYWSLSLVAKHQVKNAVQFIGHYEERSEERRVGKECVSTCRYRCSQYH